MTLLARCGRGLLSGSAMVAALMTAVPMAAVPMASARAATTPSAPVGLPGGEKTDIIFIIMDDVGIDQLDLYGYGGASPAKMPNLAKIAEQGVRFSNAWAMPQCSPSRATFFTGRYPLRTGVTNAIVDNHIPQAYLSSFETTLPRILHDVGYTSAMVGKYHLGDESDPAGTCAPSTRGFDAFIGNLTPGPPSTDYTAGGVDPTGSQTCGFFQTTESGGCYSLSADNKISCEYLRPKNALKQTTPAETCLQTGGIFTPGERCGADKPEKSAFSVDNAYYVWPQVTLNKARSPYAAPQCTDQETIRSYMTTVQSDNAVDWWKSTKGRKMLTVSYNSMHTPLQPAPNQLVRGGMQDPYNCLQALSPRGLINGMLESMDVEIGRFLEGIGRATLSKNRKTIETLDLSGIALVLVGDNGSFGPTVRTESDFSLGRAKGFVYETGVRVPLIISGDFVVEPNRDVDALVNIADLFHLFGAFANVNVNDAVPATTILDSKPLLPYVRRPDQAPIRETNYAEMGPGTFSPIPDQRSWPCFIGSSCNDVLFPTESLCINNNGTWYGPGGASQKTSCCAVINAKKGQTIFPVNQYAVRDADYKVVEMQNTDCSSPLQEGDTPAFPWAEYNLATTYEFYKVKVTKNNPTGMDNADDNLAADCGENPKDCLSSANYKRYKVLYNDLQATLNSVKPQNACAAIGDGNLDMKVDDLDIAGWESFRGKGPSRYDINVDGKTNGKDRAIILDNLGTDCTTQQSDVLKKAAALH